MSDYVYIPAAQACSIDTLEQLLQFTDHMSLWDLFDHKIDKECKVEAKVDENGYIWIRVFVNATHQFGNGPDDMNVKHGFGFILHLSDMWTLADCGETPFRQCNGCNIAHTAGIRRVSPFKATPK